MARLFWGEKDCKRDDLLRLLERFEQGLKESEVAEILGWERRTVNNYLRELEMELRVYKEGRLWFADEQD
jgi:DNA-binding NarL/FixJ family response regulator